MNEGGRVMGVRIIENDLLTVLAEDWSKVRSPSRAKRRLKQGHRQRIRHYYRPDPKAYKLPDGTVVMHPAMAQALRQRLEQNQ